MTEETTTEQLAEIEGQAESTPATEYTPPAGWRVLAVGERLRDGDMTVRKDGYCYSTERVGGWVGSNQRYIRPIESQPQPEPVQVPEPQAADTAATEYTPPDGWRLLAVGELVMLDDQWVRQDGSVWRSMGTEGPVSEGALYIRRIEPEPVWVCEGRWRTRGGDIKNIRACEPLKGAYYVWPWTDGFMTFQDNGRHQGSQESANDLVEYLGPIEPQPEPVPAVQGGLVRDVTHLLEESGVLDSAKAEQRIEELRSEVSYVQNLLGTERRRVTQLEELVASLRTINEAQEKAVEAAGKENTALRNQLAAVKAELASVAADRQRLRVELDAAQQVPADSPELRQLRLDLAEVIHDRDTYRHAHERVLCDLETIRETTKVESVQAIVEWLVPIRTCGSQALATAVISNLPHIMRSLTGLEDEGIE